MSLGELGKISHEVHGEVLFHTQGVRVDVSGCGGGCVLFECN